MSLSERMGELLGPKPLTEIVITCDADDRVVLINPGAERLLGLTLEQTLEAGLYQFLIGGVIKALLAAGILPLAWTLSSKRDR